MWTQQRDFQLCRQQDRKGNKTDASSPTKTRRLEIVAAKTDPTLFALLVSSEIDPRVHARDRVHRNAAVLEPDANIVIETRLLRCLSPELALADVRRTAKSCGPDVSTLASSRRRCSASRPPLFVEPSGFSRSGRGRCLAGPVVCVGCRFSLKVGAEVASGAGLAASGHARSTKIPPERIGSMHIQPGQIAIV